MSPRHSSHRLTHQKWLIWGGGLIGLGFILFYHVWWPIQAERALSHLQGLEKKLSYQKSTLHDLHSQYALLTSLQSLDQWAQSNGPWRTPKAKDVITLPE